MKTDDVKLLNEYLKMFESCKNSVQPDNATVQKYWCDKVLFAKARVGAMELLRRNFNDDSLYLKEMMNKVKTHELGDVLNALGILQAILLNESNKN